MAKIDFILNGQNYTADTFTIDKSKLYGTTEILALDDSGNECKAATVDESGTFIIPSGGTAVAVVDSHKNWVDRSELLVVNNDGTKAEKIEATTKQPIKLENTVTEDEYLEYSINNFYELLDVDPDFISHAKDKIFTFKYNATASYYQKDAFIVESGGRVFLLVGDKNNFEYIGLEEQAYVDENTQEDEPSEDLDFSNLF